MDPNRQRFLRDRVLTATPAQRVVMLYDRLALDLTRAMAATELGEVAGHIDHASMIVTELLGSLDYTAGGPAENLGSLYGFMLRELMQARMSEVGKLAPVLEMVEMLRSAWVAVAEGTAARADAVVGAGWSA